ncbi:uncharacterized protein Z520_08516 [Fonsecaea multimorphosa CBS 102226]|uniref:Beta-lactamase-related domain-containing protein n=1 Tax=Fonsecaea multimorphosa CBS 102226 TaxID=1442371 RepID=A0A0D2KGL7_9EURO|nr:uncharacterized protein Z520_08516 [Fonsecaea multimorphosa CBS 102226]KIX95808.1 hypothetical protein Z520_08516 [Fonsecaea multimorphosa CBS 102226]OAL21544.1 hypothetical protein AYO22_07940 [Fonsecaea multimorphosa]
MSSENKYLDAEFDAFMQALLEKHHVPGMSIGIVDGGQVFTKAYGFARLPDVPATDETLYFTGSTTKAMVAAALGRVMSDEPEQHQEQNEPVRTLRKHRWATPISQILPDDFVLEDERATSEITIEDALSHRTGFSGADNLYGRWMGTEPKGITKALRFLGGPNKSFRTTWQYNNLMYSVLGDVLETTTGLSWGAALRKLLWQPLKMLSTYWTVDEIPDDKRESIARGYFWVPSSSVDDGKGDFIPERYLDFAGIAPAGSVVSNVIDYAKWIKALLRAANHHEETSETQNVSFSEEAPTVITPTLFAELTTPRMLQTLLAPMNKNSHLTPRSYSLGWSNMSSTMGLKHPIVAHAGGLTGFGTQLYLLPNDDFGCVTLGNTTISSHKVGEAVSIEFMARKLGLSGSSKAEFSKSLSIFDALDELTALAGKAAEVKPSEAAPDADISRGGQLTESLCDELVGTYHHPAYGSYRVSRDQGPKRDRVLCGFQVSEKDKRYLEALWNERQTLYVLPVGHHTWGNQFVLHVRGPEKNGESKASTASDEKSVVFLDLECLTLHGQDPDDTKGVSSSLQWQVPHATRTVWETQNFCRRGAAFTAVSKAEGSTSSSAWKLGLRLANEYMAAEGSTDEGWESEMAWFTK